MVLALLIVAAAGCGSAGLTPPTLWPYTVAAHAPSEIRVRVGTRVVTVAFEDYVAGTAVSEITPVGESTNTVATVYDAQTVVARTYAVAHLGRHASEGFDVCDTTHCQLYEPARLGTSRFATAVRQAAARTAGQVLTWQGRPIDAVFHADCGGHTASPAQVWGTAPLPYLPSEPDTVPEVQHRTWTVTVTKEQVRSALNGDRATAVGPSITDVAVAAFDASGRAETVRITGARWIELRGDEFRAALTRVLGPKGLPSTRFTVTRTRTGYQFSGTGFGHGVGLCQQGMLARARRGTGVRAILSDFFPGTAVSRLDGRIP